MTTSILELEYHLNALFGGGIMLRLSWDRDTIIALDATGLRTQDEIDQMNRYISNTWPNGIELFRCEKPKTSLEKEIQDIESMGYGYE